MIWLDKNSPVIENELTILYKLQEECIKRGKQYFYTGFKVKGSEIMLSCPVHKDGQERRASSSITTVDKPRKGGGLVPAGTFHCFACQTTMNFTELVSYCLGSYDNGSTGEEWIRDNFTIGYSLELTELERLKSLEELNLVKKDEFISEEELDKYRYYHDYMFKRGLTEQIIQDYDIGFDQYFKLDENSMYIPCITFPVRNMNGDTLFVARRAVKTKLFHYKQDVNKPVYGLYELYKYNELFDDPSKCVDSVVVCESIFNALTCVKWGFPAVALLGTGNHEQYNVLDRLPCKRLYICLDPDVAGNSGTEKLISKLNKSNIFVIDLPYKQDVNDVDECTFKKCFNNATVSFMWKRKYFE